jgi:hypothetical protein
LADESKDGALKISSREELQNWLESLSPERGRWVSVTVAARAALRVVPLVATAAKYQSDEERKRSLPRLSFPIFYASALAWVAAAFPTRADALRSAARAAAAKSGPFSAAYNSATTAAFAAAATDDGKSAASAAFAAANAADAATNADVWSLVSRDANFIASGGAAQALASMPPWPNGAPNEMMAHWWILQTALPREDDWQVWIDWYIRRLQGALAPEEIELVFAAVPERELEAGPAAANKWIKERIDELRKRDETISRAGRLSKLIEAQRQGRPSEQPALPAWDFFISASTLDEADAREVAAVLEQAGHSTFAQFKDIAPGNNFVREMQSGLDDSGRMIALYSPEYESSDHCQAEWSAAYNSDPSGKKRKLIPFLLRPTALNSLARQVIYKSLVGLSKEARKAAILDAIAPKPAKRDIAQVRAELAETASPQPALNEKKQVDAGPNKVFDKPFVDQDLVDLPYTQRALIRAILRALPRNAPKIVDSALRSYDDHVQERGSQPITRLLNDFASALEKEIEAIKTNEPELLGPGNASLFESFLRNNALLATHFPLKNEEKFAEVSVDEEKATGDALVRPIKDVADKMNDAVASGIATEKIGQIASNSAQFATDIAPLPPDASASEPGSRRVTLKRRYVLGTLGFLVALYNLLGSTASILATEQGAALFEAVRKAIEALSKFLL